MTKRGDNDCNAYLEQRVHMDVFLQVSLCHDGSYRLRKSEKNGIDDVLLERRVQWVRVVDRVPVLMG